MFQHEAVTSEESKYMYLQPLSAFQQSGYTVKLIAVEVGSHVLPNTCGFNKLRRTEPLQNPYL